MTKNLKQILLKYKHSLILLYFFIYIPWFSYLEKTITRRYNVIHMAIDDHIPLIEVFIIPYLLWFFYIAAAIVFFFLTNVADYYKLCFFLFTGMTVFLIISTLYPNGHNLRPLIYDNHNIFTTAVKWLHSHDTPTNLFPSIHVYNSIGVHIAVSHSEKLKHHKWIRFGSFTLMMSIILSTVFLKQHSVFDVITGILLAVLVYSLVYAIDWQKLRRKVYDGQISSNI